MSSRALARLNSQVVIGCNLQVIVGSQICLNFIDSWVISWITSSSLSCKLAGILEATCSSLKLCSLQLAVVNDKALQSHDSLEQ